MENIEISAPFEAFNNSIFSIKVTKKHCQLCGSLFKSWQNRRYCSTSCSKEARRVKVRANVMALSKRRNFGKITASLEQINKNLSTLIWIKQRRRLGFKFLDKALKDGKTYDQHSIFSQYEQAKEHQYKAFDEALSKSGGHLEDELDYLPESDYGGDIPEYETA